MAPAIVHLPEMSMTLVRRVSARLPHNQFLFRVEPSVTKHEVREYLRAVYGCRVARVSTSVSLGKVRRVPGKAKMFHRLKDFKRVLVQLADDETFVATTEAAPSPSAANGGGDAAAREKARAVMR